MHARSLRVKGEARLDEYLPGVLARYMAMLVLQHKIERLVVLA